MGGILQDSVDQLRRRLYFQCLYYKKVFNLNLKILDEILFFQSNCRDYFNDCDSTLLGLRETKLNKKMCRFVGNQKDT